MNRPKPPASVADRFRGEIEKAAAEGAALDDMTLHLTLGDATKLQRDPKIAVADIRFADGEMRYLGVKVVRGGVAESALLQA